MEKVLSTSKKSASARTGTSRTVYKQAKEASSSELPFPVCKLFNYVTLVAFYV